MDTKKKGDLAEQAVVLEAMKNGWGVLHPVGDRLSYDLALDIGNAIVRVQVKSAWLDSKSGNYLVDVRRSNTNRRRIFHKRYGESDFDFAIAYIEELSVFYVFPVKAFLAFSSHIHLVETARRQRRPGSAEFRQAWHLISDGHTSG